MDCVEFLILPKTVRLVRLVFIALMLMIPVAALAGPAEEANEVVDHWSAAYSANDPEAVVKNYWPAAIPLGTVSPVISDGTEAIRSDFSGLKGSGNKNAIGERLTIVISHSSVQVTGSYEFIRMREGKPVPGRRALPCLLSSVVVNGISLTTILLHMFYQISKPGQLVCCPSIQPVAGRQHCGVTLLIELYSPTNKSCEIWLRPQLNRNCR